jgi:tetratricopeptide (TPR) repeat protein
MNVSLFSRVDLPDQGDKSFDDLLLGELEYDRTRAARPPEEAVTKVDVQELLFKAQENYFHGFYLDGLKYYARALRADQKQTRSWIGQIRILVDIGRSDAAVYWADKGLGLFGDSKLMTFAKAFALAHAGRIEDAKRIINIPVEKSEAAMLWLFRGEVLIRIKLGIFQKIFRSYKGIGRMGAFFCFLKALSPDPEDAFLHQRIGFAYLLAKYDERAFEHLQTSLAIVPDNPLTVYGLAECYRRKKDYERAIYYVKKAIAKNPNLDIAYELLQWIHHPARKFFGRVLSVKGKGRS